MGRNRLPIESRSTASVFFRVLDYRWRLVCMLWIVGFLNYADRQAIFSVFPLLRTQLHLSMTELGLVASVFAWVYGVAAPLAGYLVDRIRRTTAIIAGLQCWSWVCTATALSSGLWSLVFMRCAMGLGESLYFPASISIMSDYHGPRSRSRALSLHQTSVYAGTIAGGFLAGWIADSFDWRWPFVCFGGAGILFSLFLMRFLIEPERGKADQRIGANNCPSQPMPFGAFVSFAAKSPAVWLLMLAFVCANFVAVVLLVWMPTYLYQTFHFSLAISGLTATAFAQIGSIAGTAFGGWLADRLIRKRSDGRVLVQCAGVVMGAPFVFLCSDLRSIPVVLAALAAWGFFKGLYDANLFAALYDNIPISVRGAATGWMNTMGWLGGGGLAPLLVGIAATRFGLGTAMSFVSIVYLVAAVFLIAAARAQSKTLLPSIPDLPRST